MDRADISSADRTALSTALSDSIRDPDVASTCVAQFEIYTVAADTIIPALGLCVVLQGTVSLERDGEPLGVAGPLAHFFDDSLVSEDCSGAVVARARDAVRLAVLSRAAWQALAPEIRQTAAAGLLGDLLTTHVHEFQQPLNCCNVTALALSLTALGFPTDLDAIFQRCQLPAAYVVNEGLTLADLFDVACMYVHLQGLGEQVSVECHYFDADATARADLIAALAESRDKAGSDDILIANFDVATAHAEPSFRGGHFALLAKHNPGTDLVYMVDVHPEKYGKLWVTNTSRIHAAMVARDPSSYRARGLLRLSTGRGLGTRLTALQRDCVAVATAPHVFERPALNLGGLNSLAASLRTLGLPNVDANDLIRAGNFRHTELLAQVPSPVQLDRAVRSYVAQVGFVEITSSVRAWSESQATADGPAQWFEQQLRELIDPTRVQMLVNIDLNRVLGCDAIAPPTPAHGAASHHRDFWCIVKHYEPQTQMLSVSDTSSATPYMWRAPLASVYRGLEDPQDPTLLVLNRANRAGARDVDEIVRAHKLVLFHCDDDADSYALRCVLANIGVSDLQLVDITRHEFGSSRLRHQLVTHSGRDEVPYLYFDGKCLGDTESILEMVRLGELQAMLARAGLSVLNKQQTPSLDHNIYGYPKGGLTGAREPGRRRVLLSACGSTAADKIPEMIERLVDLDYEVKLLLSARAEHFFEDFGMRRIRAKLEPSDIYRDDDEWSFRYTTFGMPIRACHLALCDWADCLVVAPITCNTMAKMAHGIGDNMLTSVFVAWQYQKKPVILCPACNTDMWNNITTQDNVARLRQLGARFEGPRSGRLSNGSIGIGMMALPEQVVAAVGGAFDDLGDRTRWVMKWGAQAAAANRPEEWRRIYRMIDEGVVDIDVRAPDTGDTLLHYAAGGEGEMTEDGISKGVPDFEAARELIRRGIDIDATNHFGFTSLHVALMNDSAEMVELLLEAGANAIPCLELIDTDDISEPIRQRLRGWAREHA